MLGPQRYDVCTDKTGHAEVVQIGYEPSVVSYKELLPHSEAVTTRTPCYNHVFKVARPCRRAGAICKESFREMIQTYFLTRKHRKE